MFLFKKIVSQFFFPMPLCLFLCFTGLALLWWTKKQKAGKLLVTFGLLLLTAFSYSPVADALLRPLERRYPVYVKGDSPPIPYVVVLGGGHTSDPALPVSSQIGDESLKRLVEGIRIYRENPGSKLLLSGGSWIDRTSNAEIMAETAGVLGVSRRDILLELNSRDTDDQARMLRGVLTTNAFVLVTSASHMLRSVKLFEREGLRPQPAPTDHLVKQARFEPAWLFPRGRCLRRTETALYEFFGLGWSALRSRR